MKDFKILTYLFIVMFFVSLFGFVYTLIDGNVVHERNVPCYDRDYNEIQGLVCKDTSSALDTYGGGLLMSAVFGFLFHHLSKIRTRF